MLRARHDGPCDQADDETDDYVPDDVQHRFVGLSHRGYHVARIDVDVFHEKSASRVKTVIESAEPIQDSHSLQALATGVANSRTATEANTMAANTSNAALAFQGSNFPAIPVKKQNRSEQHSEQNISVGRLVRYICHSQQMFRVLLEPVHFGSARINYAPGVSRHHKWMCGRVRVLQGL